MIRKQLSYDHSLNTVKSNKPWELIEGGCSTGRLFLNPNFQRRACMSDRF